MITEKERESLVASLESLLQKYNYKYTVEALNKVIDEWDRQKGWLIEAFKKHPGYVEGQFMIVVDDEYRREVDVNGCRKFTQWWASYPYYDTDLVKEEVRCHSRSSNISDEQYEILRFLHHHTERCISVENVTVFKRAFPDVSIHAGEKMTRVVNKLFNYLGYNKHEDYNKEFAKYSDAMTPKTIKRRIVLSVNPLDYLTMSFGNSWSSCHTIDKENIRDMPHGYQGRYSSGTISYMLDPSSMVMYTVDQKYDGNEYWDQPKINRQMFHYGEEKLVQGRLYPQDNDNSQSEYVEYARAIRGIISTIFDIKGEWSSERGGYAASKYILSKGTHYRDYANFSNCTLHMPVGCENNNKFTVGHDPICVRCGEMHGDEETIDCCIYSRCKHCGQRIYDGDEVYHVDGETYCRRCVTYCNCCGEYFVGNGHYTHSGRVCTNCFNEHYAKCEECGAYVRKGLLEERDGKHICRRCQRRIERDHTDRPRSSWMSYRDVIDHLIRVDPYQNDDLSWLDNL